MPGDLRARFTRLEALSALNRREWWRGGQHLKRRKRYLGGHLFDRVKGLYFTTGRPAYYGIRAESVSKNPRWPAGRPRRTPTWRFP